MYTYVHTHTHALYIYEMPDNVNLTEQRESTWKELEGVKGKYKRYTYHKLNLRLITQDET